MVKICKDDEILNPVTNKCVKRTGAIGKKLLKNIRSARRSGRREKFAAYYGISSPSRTSSKRVSSKRSVSKRICKDDEILNPVTNKCVKKTGAIGKKLLKNIRSARRSGRREKFAAYYGIPSPSATSRRHMSKRVICKDDEILNPVSNKCVKRTGAIGKKLLKSKSPASRRPVSRRVASRRPVSRRVASRRPVSSRVASRRPVSRRAIENKLLKSKNSDSICKDDEILNPETGKCVKKTGAIGKKIISDMRKAKEKIRNDENKKRKSYRWKIEGSKKIKSTCISRSKISLKDHQIKVARYMNDNDSLLVVHGLGCGKTLTSITVSQCYLDQYPDHKVVFVGPAGLIDNFKKEMKKYGVQNSDKYSYFSFSKFLNDTKNDVVIDCDRTLLIIDEVHNLRSLKSSMYDSVLQCAMRSHKRLLLSATPFVNSITDFGTIINILYGRRIIGTRKEFDEGIVTQYITKQYTDADLDLLIHYLEDKVDVVDCKDEASFPEKIEHYINIPMSMDYYDKYLTLIGGDPVGDTVFYNPEKFYNGFRRAINALSKTDTEYFSRKIIRSIPIIKSGKTLIYTNWLDFGVVPLKRIFEKEDITYALIYGDVDKSKRQDIVNKFNNGEYDVLVITKAGGEGLDLKEVMNVIILGPPWNESALDQAVGRAIRFKSHINLPPEERVVNVYYMVSTDPGIRKWDPRKENPHYPEISESGDIILYRIIEQKKQISNDFLKVLKELSI